MQSSLLGIVLDPMFQRHVTVAGHPERMDRYRALTDIDTKPFHLIAPQPIDRALLERVHTSAYIDSVAESCRLNMPLIDENDCSICPESYSVALHAAGSVAQAARLILSGTIRRAFCAVRPPGHHAERNRAMGFCLFGNVALAAEVARHEFKLDRVLIVDWDVHHGNGTQHIFEHDADVLFISLHGHPNTLYPGTGFAHETGIGAGKGFTLNVPMMPGARDEEYQAAFERHVLPAAEKFKPQLLIISAGFDAHAEDPLGNINLSDDGFLWMLERLIDVANRHCSGKILSVLEGGYNLDVLRRCVPAHIHRLAAD